MNWDVRVIEWKECKQDGKERSVNSLGEKERGGALEIVDGLATFVDDAWNSLEAGVEKYKFAGATSSVGTFANG